MKKTGLLISKKKEKKLIFFCNYIELQKKNYIKKFFDELNDEIIIFIDHNKKIKIFSSVCPHFGGEIFYDNQINTLRCKWHDWKFCVNSGKCLTFPIKGKLNKYEIDIKPNLLTKYKLEKNDNKIYIINHE